MPSFLIEAVSARPVMKGHLVASLSFLRIVKSSMEPESNLAMRFVKDMLKKFQEVVPVKLGMANRF